MPDITYEDREIIEKLIVLLEHDQYISLCTVVKTWGSSPRPIGSMMLISEHGKFYGSVSGGCIEDDLLEKHNDGFFDNQDLSMLTYDRNTENAHIKIPCGSILKILVEKIFDPTQFKQISQHLSQGQRIIRKLSLHDHSSSISKAELNSDNLLYNDDFLIKSYGPAWKILIIGANSIAQYMIQLADMLGYNIIICEPRENYRENFIQQISEDETHIKFTRKKAPIQVTSLMPDDAVKKFATDFYTIILSLSHDPKLDDMALMSALELELFYVGAIGSKKTCAARNERLALLDLTPASIDKLHAPVGIDINSKTPAEIAISIFSHLTILKNKHNDHAS